MQEKTGPVRPLSVGWCLVSAAVLCGTVFLSWCGLGRACSIPVYQYALERWPSDPYDVIVLYEGKLSAKEQEILSWLKQCSEKAPYANLRVTARELGSLSEEERKVLPGNGKNLALPYLVVKYPPFFRIPVFAWQGPLTRSGVRRLIDSPARKEIARRLLAGHTAVWVFLPSGNKAADSDAKKRLKAVLEKASSLLELPEPPPDPFAEEEYTEQPVGENLQAEGQESEESKEEEKEPEARHPVFSILEVDRKDQREAAFVSMLLGTEPDLRNLKEPMTFPIFGRGRVLFAFVGKGINEENIGEACMFLTGPCSCQVKGMNPGVDLLMAVDWESAIEALYSGEPSESLPLASLPALAGAEEEKKPAESEAGGSGGGGSFLILVLGGLGILLVLGTALGTAVILRRKNGNG